MSTDSGSGAPEEAPEPVVDEDGQPIAGTPLVEEDLAQTDPFAAQITELTADLQRLQAEYTNYRRRVERDRDLQRDLAVSGVLAELLPILDDIGRAREHDELTGAFRSVGEAVESTVARLGLERFGEAGEPFDPSVHEAISHTHSPDVTETTCVAVLQPGYRFAGRVVRPARVAVADPE
jgi:molecular chaperone GrpE